MPERPTAAGPSPFAALSPDRADALVQSLPLAPGRHVLALACGQAELLLRIVEAHPATTGTGVDHDRAALDAGRAEIARRGLHERVELVEADPGAFDDHADLVLWVAHDAPPVGAEGALARLRELVLPGGRALLGMPLGDAGPTLPGLAALAAEAGFDVEHALDSTIPPPSAEAAGGTAARLARGFGWVVARPR